MEDPIAAMDQWKQGLKDYARGLAVFHEELRAQGFTAAEALALTMTYIDTLNRRGIPKDDG